MNICYWVITHLHLSATLAVDPIKISKYNDAFKARFGLAPIDLNKALDEVLMLHANSDLQDPTVNQKFASLHITWQ